MNKENFIKEVKKLNIDITNNELNLLETYYQILVEYNAHTNLTTIINEEEIYLKHFYDSLTICKVIDLKKVNSLLDIGSGAGFPGLVLKIFFPHLDLYLLDSNNKKIKFLKILTKKLNIEATIIHARAEEYIKEKINYFDLVTARAVANLRILSEISLPFVKKDQYFIALKGNIDDELREAQETIVAMNSEIVAKIIFSLPKERGIRTLIKIIKKSNSNLKNLRQYNKILKNGLKKLKK